MPISSNRSPSPLSRSTDASNGGMRKSFNGNPLSKSSRSFNPATPANSPAEFPRRKEGIAGLRGSREFKENEKKAKEGGEIKGAKSFMAPTISAMSKISPSPRKKVLGERNESVEEEVISFASKVIPEPKIHLFKPKSLEFHEVSESVDDIDITPLKASDPPIQEVYVKPHVVQEEIHEPVNPPEEGYVKPHVVQEEIHEPVNPPEEVCVKPLVHKPPASPAPAPIDCDPCFLNAKHCSSPSPTVAPLDSDPHLPPYDPKTNYLSPRPQFLHYKPKPRIEVYIEKGGSDSEGKKLEDSFSSESNSDTERSDDTLSAASPKESENESTSSDLLSEEENQTAVSENELDYTQLKTSPKPRSRSFVRSKLVPLLFVFAIAGLVFPVIDTPVFSPSTYDGQTFYNLDALASNVKLWSNQIHSYISTLVSPPRGVVVQEFAPVYYSNSTILNEEVSLGYDVYQFKEVGDEFDMEVEMNSEIEEMSKEEEYKEEVDSVVTEEYSTIESEELALVTMEEVDSVMITEEYSTMASEEQPALVHEIPELQAEYVQDQESHGFDTISEMIDAQEFADPQSSFQSPDLDVLVSKSELDTSDPIEEPDVIDVDGEEAHTSAVQNMENLSPVQKLVGVVSAVFAMLAAAVCCYLKHRKAAATTEVEKSAKASMQEKIVSNGEIDEDRFSSRPTEVEMFGESGPSEMSSSYKRGLSYDLKGSERMSDAQSGEKRPRYSKRESLATSSDYSYGSFYETIHSKYGYGEEEVVTPVRRSSRIRKIVSPSS